MTELMRKEVDYFCDKFKVNAKFLRFVYPDHTQTTEKVIAEDVDGQALFVIDGNDGRFLNGQMFRM